MDDRLNKKGGKPSNAELIAERKAIRELLDVPPGIPTLVALETVIAQREQLRVELKNAVHLTGAPPFVLPPAPVPSPFDRANLADTSGLDVPMPQRDAPEIEKKPHGVPVDTAVYPGFNDHLVPVPAPVVGEPPMSPVHGDLTPAYVRWLLVNSSPAAVRERYKDRLHLLPNDVRGALVRGALA